MDGMVVKVINLVFILSKAGFLLFLGVLDMFCILLLLLSQETC